jgi:hypothetical protein
MWEWVDFACAFVRAAKIHGNAYTRSCGYHCIDPDTALGDPQGRYHRQIAIPGRQPRPESWMGGTRGAASTDGKTNRKVEGDARRAQGPEHDEKETLARRTRRTCCSGSAAPTMARHCRPIATRQKHIRGSQARHQSRREERERREHEHYDDEEEYGAEQGRMGVVPHGYPQQSMAFRPQPMGHPP